MQWVGNNLYASPSVKKYLFKFSIGQTISVNVWNKIYSLYSLKNV